MADGADLPIDAVPDAVSDPASETGDEAHAVRPIDRTGILLFAIPMAVTTILAWAGDIFYATLIKNDMPIVLILLNPRLRNLVQVAPIMAAGPFVVISAARLIVVDPFFYWFGLRYGDVTIRWMEEKLGAGASIVLWFERFFAKASYVAVAVLPNQWICLMAGATRMKRWAFITLNIGGTFVRVILIWVLGDAFSEPILAINGWIGDHWILVTAITFTIVVVAVWRTTNKGQKAIETPGDILAELEEARDDTAPESTPLGPEAN